MSMCSVSPDVVRACSPGDLMSSKSGSDVYSSRQKFVPMP